MKFNEKYKTLADRKRFLEGFDLVNLKKAAKIGNISTVGNPSKERIIKQIVDYDAKNKNLIAKTMSVSYTHLTLPTTCTPCRSRWSPDH